MRHLRKLTNTFVKLEGEWDRKICSFGCLAVLYELFWWTEYIKFSLGHFIFSKDCKKLYRSLFLCVQISIACVQLMKVVCYQSLHMGCSFKKFFKELLYFLCNKTLFSKTNKKY